MSANWFNSTNRENKRKQNILIKHTHTHTYIHIYIHPYIKSSQYGKETNVHMYIKCITARDFLAELSERNKMENQKESGINRTVRIRLEIRLLQSI